MRPLSIMSCSVRTMRWRRVSRPAGLGSSAVVAFIDHCTALIPKPAGRDTRRQRIVRTLQDLIDKGRMPCGVTDESFIFA